MRIDEKSQIVDGDDLLETPVRRQWLEPIQGRDEVRTVQDIQRMEQHLQPQQLWLEAMVAGSQQPLALEVACCGQRISGLAPLKHNEVLSALDLLKSSEEIDRVLVQCRRSGTGSA